LSESKYITFGTTVVSLAAVVTMSEQEFKSMFSGILTTDVNEAWKEVKKHQPKVAKSQQKRGKRKSNKED
jgi:hypothetical protein